MPTQGVAARVSGNHTKNPMPSALLYAALALLCLYVIGSLLGGILLAEIALHPRRSPVTPAESKNVRTTVQADSSGFQEVEVSASDGTSLRAWYLWPAAYNDSVVILPHGVSDNRLGMLGFGRILLAHHYAVLLPDARAHGNSGGAIATYGVEEAGDIHAWVEWLNRTGHPNCIFGLGESMGAAQLLQSLQQEPRFCAVVAESSFSTFREVAYDRVGQAFRAGPWLGKTLFRLLVDIGFIYARVHYHVDLEQASPLAAVSGTHVPVLLIHGIGDHNIPLRHSEAIHASNPSDTTLWRVPGAPHTGAYRTRPSEFEQRVIRFFETHSHSLRAVPADPEVPRLRSG
jgi:dipeptidyl aminopeptidase/acylaminoacyl peptidase